MIEACHVEHRPWLYFFLRRFELIRWTLRGRVLHSEARWYAPLLLLWLAITGYETERCDFCGWKVHLVWYSEDQALWETVTGYKNGTGIACVDCFNKRAYTKNLPLRWTVRPLCSQSREI